MLPPGRRRISTLPLAILALLLFTSTASAASAVLGIDLGTEYIKAALVKPGIPLEIVLSRDSKRKEAVAVAFKPAGTGRNVKVAEGEYPERLYGSDAMALTARRPDDVYVNLKQLLGLPIDAAEVKEYQSRYPALQVVKQEGRDAVSFESPSFNKLDVPFSIEEILAMELKNVRQNAQTLAGKGHAINNAVFTIPAFYTADERRAVELAADLAGLKVLGMVTDGLAVGINYATTRTFPSINEAAKDGTMGKPEHHMVFDMGAGSTTATVLKMQGRTVKDVGRFNKTIQEVMVLGSAWDKTLGGDTLNRAIVADMVGQFVDSSAAKSAGVEAEKVKAHGRANAKLWKDAERLRQVLSANQEASASFEGLFEDVDFRYKLSRGQFEELGSNFAERIDKPITQALEAAKLKMEDLDSIILHGGAVRTPMIQKKLESLVGGDASKLRSNVNADEAAVFGAAFKGAGLSPSFRVKEIKDTDAASYTAGIRYMVDGKEKSQKLFIPTSLIGAAKQVTLKNLDDVDFTLFQQVPAGERPVVKIQTTNLTDSVKQLVDKFSCAKEEIATKFSIRLDPVNGLPEVVQGTVSCEIDDAKKGSIADNVKGLFGFGSKKEKGSQEVFKDGFSPEELGQQAESSETEASKSSSSTQILSSSATAEAKSETLKKRTETVNIAFVTTPQGLESPSEKELKRMKDRLTAFDASDAARVQRSDLLNSLEALTYRVRDWLEDAAFTASATASEQSSLKALAKEAGEWIYGDGAHANVKALKEKLKGLNDILGPIQKRRDEATKRPEQIKLLQDALDQTKAMAAVVKESLEEAAAKAKEEGEAALSAAEASASSVASAASEEASSATSAVEGDESSSSSSSATASPSPSASPESFFPTYTPEDLTAITSVYDDISEWLSEKLALQQKLGPSDDPAVLSTDLEAKAKELNKALMDVIQRKIYTPPKKPKSKSSKSTKSKTKSKGKKDKTLSDTKEAEAKTSEAAGPTPEADPSAANPPKHEEL
ncbi:actin-like ATPase domain-containing protein [Rhizodiscina lignyota]|uniref:Actin-like ATPase domain-containing protein n=1 Tax=Rhizodiscina lignyota TaxID=1504668 RepID=A0A9P4I0I9_9PEZI|nr:actin-like ATPase domain-containing protein [Rhizodiscina lignyota]